MLGFTNIRTQKMIFSSNWLRGSSCLLRGSLCNNYL